MPSPRPRSSPSPEQEASLAILRAQDWVQGELSALLESRGVSAQQYNVLRILRGAGSDGLPCLEIGARMIQRMPDITRLVDRLESAGLVERRRIAEDRRVVLVKATRRGLELLAELDRPVADLHRQLLGHLTRAELAELTRLLARAMARNAMARNAATS